MKFHLTSFRVDCCRESWLIAQTNIIVRQRWNLHVFRILGVAQHRFVQLSLRRLMKEDWGKVPSVPITPPASQNSSSLFFSTLMFISPFRGLLLRAATSRESLIMIDRKFCILFLYAWCDITEMNNSALHRTSFIYLRFYKWISFFTAIYP